MENQEDIDKRPASPKKIYPFGTPDHGKFCFSSFSHLTGESLRFAKELARSSNPARATTQEQESNDKKEKKKAKKSKKARPQAENIPGLDLPEADKGQPACTRAECKEVILSILDTQKKNQLERDQIVDDCEKMIQLQQQLEDETNIIEGINKSNVMEYNILEGQLSNLRKKCQIKEEEKLKFDTEKDDLATKVMHLELEKQRCSRRAAEIHAALGEVMWKGSTNLLNETPYKSNLYIEPFDDASFHRADNPSSGSYISMVNDSILDVSERPLSVPVLHDHLRSNALGGSFRSVGSTRSGKFTNTGGLSSFNSITSDITFQSSRKLPVSPLSKKLKGRTMGTLRAKTTKGGYRGYTPSGGSRLSGNSRTRNSSTAAELVDDDASSALSSLDPVFYMERARSSWGRDVKLGKVRLRDDPPGYRRKMLTSLGHPNAFGDETISGKTRTAPL